MLLINGSPRLTHRLGKTGVKERNKATVNSRWIFLARPFVCLPTTAASHRPSMKQHLAVKSLIQAPTTRDSSQSDEAQGHVLSPAFGRRQPIHRPDQQLQLTIGHTASRIRGRGLVRRRPKHRCCILTGREPDLIASCVRASPWLVTGHKCLPPSWFAARGAAMALDRRACADRRSAAIIYASMHGSRRAGQGARRLRMAFVDPCSVAAWWWWRHQRSLPRLRRRPCAIYATRETPYGLTIPQTIY